MSSSVAALLAAVLIAAAPEPPDAGVEPVPSHDPVASILPADQLEDIALEALPPPPSTVVRQTRYYGTVTIDHRAHLARRAPCRTCHGTAAITKLTFTPKVAHDRCIGCHQEWKKGPTACQGCHVKSPPPTEVEIVAAKSAVPLEPPKPPEPNPANVAAAMQAFDMPKPEGLLGNEPFSRWIEVGLAAGQGQGISARVASHQNYVVITQGVDRIMSDDLARTYGLIGAGISRPIHSRVALEGIALAGFDAVDRPFLALLPAIGARTGLEWRPRFKFVQQITASVTGVYDLSSRQYFRQQIGGLTVYGTVSAGFKFAPR